MALNCLSQGHVRIRTRSKEERTIMLSALYANGFFWHNSSRHETGCETPEKTEIKYPFANWPILVVESVGKISGSRLDDGTEVNGRCIPLLKPNWLL